MREILAGNIARYRKSLGLTQEALADKLGITFQAVSKWETGQTMPDTALLTPLASVLNISVDKLLGYSTPANDFSFYDDKYSTDDYFWGVAPNKSCLRVLEFLPPNKPLKLLDIGCGEGKDAVFFARCGYDVSAFDISEAGLDKTKRLAEKARVHVRAFRANIWDYRLNEHYDVLYSSGALHYIKPKLRDDIMTNYKAHINPNGIAAFHAFVEKPFIAPAPDDGERYLFNCNSSGIPHRHAANRMVGRNVQ